LFQELRDQVSKLLDKQAIEEVLDGSPGFYSRLFLATKKSGEWRPVIDLSRLNSYMSPPHFKMETVASILQLVTPGQWATSVDLKDAFFHVPVAPRHRRFLRFSVDNKLYQFRALPFGLGMSPYVFTRIMKAVGTFVRSQGLSLALYLDDWMLLSSSCAEAEAWIKWLLELARALGLVVNLEKSDTIPSQIFIFIGILINLILGTAQPAPPRVETFLKLANLFLRTRAPTAGSWQQLLGHMTSLEKLVPRGRLHMRPLQFSLQSQWQQGFQSQEVHLVPSREALQAVLWWVNVDNLQKGVSIVSTTPDLRLFTDASLEGWGAHLGEAQAEGVWSADLRTAHINLLELRAVLLALEQFLPLVRGHHVLVMCDNTTVVGQVKNQGGTHSLDLFLLTRDLFSWADTNRVVLSAQHIPGRLNVLADRLSRRHQVIHTEWSLAPSVARRIWKLWGQPHLDLFATRDNAKLPLFVSPFLDDAAWGTDALSLSWTGMWLYAFPPFPLLPEVLDKVRLESCDMILVAPAWPSQSWFHLLMSLVIDHPRSLPLSPKLLRQPGTSIFHNGLERLHLHVWRLSSRPCRPKDFLRTWLGVSPTRTVLAPSWSMIAAGVSSVFGARIEDGILSLPLPL
jgi:ribonuclease HI